MGFLRSPILFSQYDLRLVKRITFLSDKQAILGEVDHNMEYTQKKNQRQAKQYKPCCARVCHSVVL